ncbi:MAG: DNA-processing protein DprA [Dongiaceae bacterium]
MTQHVTLSDAERIDWLRLSRSENVGPITFRQLLQRFGGAGAALAALPDLARRGGRNGALKIHGRNEAASEITAIHKLGGRLIASVEPDYPLPLAALDDAPPLITVLGDVALLTRQAVAIVGARNASANGRRLAEDIARDIGGAGFLVVSGLARGIDSAAHRGSLRTGTAAVVAGGADMVYPPENGELHHAIAEQGLIVAEMPLGTVPQARHFPRRNRLISGLALGVLVAEAALKSGSLITARFALEQGREVLAVPGSPLDPRCRGSNNLIRQGATLVESAADVLAALAAMTPAGPSPISPPTFSDQEIEITEFSGDSAARTGLESLLGPDPVAVDELVRQCQLSAPSIRAALLELELAGRLERHPGNRVSLLLTNAPHR